MVQHFAIHLLVYEEPSDPSLLTLPTATLAGIFQRHRAIAHAGAVLTSPSPSITWAVKSSKPPMSNLPATPSISTRSCGAEVSH